MSAGLAIISIVGFGIAVVFAALIFILVLLYIKVNYFNYMILGFAITEVIALFGLMMAFLIFISLTHNLAISIKFFRNIVLILLFLAILFDFNPFISIALAEGKEKVIDLSLADMSHNRDYVISHYEEGWYKLVVPVVWGAFTYTHVYINQYGFRFARLILVRENPREVLFREPHPDSPFSDSMIFRSDSLLVNCVCIGLFLAFLYYMPSKPTITAPNSHVIVLDNLNFSEANIETVLPFVAFINNINCYLWLYTIVFFLVLFFYCIITGLLTLIKNQTF